MSTQQVSDAMQRAARHALAPLQCSDDEFDYVVERVMQALAAQRRETIEECIAKLWERMQREEYGHAKAAVALDIEALRSLLPPEAKEDGE